MARVIRTAGEELYPTAQCDDPGCQWSHPESRYTREAAKTHAKDKPGHLVIVQVVKRDAYRLVGP